MSAALRKPGSGGKYWLNALVLIAPFWFLYDALTAVLPPAWPMQVVGPFEVTPTPRDADGPYEHDGIPVKDFAFRFCEGCVERIRMAYANVGPEATAETDGGEGVVHGHGALQEAHVPYPIRPGPTDRLWLTVQEWDGTLHRVAWPLPAAPD